MGGIVSGIGSAIGGIFGGGGSNTVSQSTALPSWLATPIRENIAEAETIAARPYQAYSGSTVAGLSPSQTQAINLAQTGVATGQGQLNAAQTAVNNAISGFGNVGMTSPASVAAQQIGTPTAGYTGIGAQNVGSQNIGYGGVTSRDIGVDNVSGSTIGAQNVGSQNIGYGNVGAQTLGTQNIGAQTIGTSDVASQNIAAQNIAAQNAAAAGYNAALMRGPANVQAQNFLSGDISAYMNPYTQSVIDAAMKDLASASNFGIQQIGQQARQAGAFGGSRQGIAEALQRSQDVESAGRLSANLRSQAFQDAASRMSADQARQMQADLANQQAGLSTAQLNQAAQMQALSDTAGFRQQSNLANQDAALRASLANQQTALTAGQSNQDAALRAALANQQAGITTSQANQDAALRASLANQQMGFNVGQANQSAALQAALANQQAGITTGQSNQEAALRAALANQQAGLTAGQSNQDVALRAQLANQQAGLTAGQANQAAAMQAALANQQAGITTGQSNQEAALRAALANQQAGLTAAQANQQAGITTGLANQQAALTTSQANQDAALRAALANQQMGFNVGQANQQARLAGLEGQLAGANQLAQLGLLNRDLQSTGIGELLSTGAVSQAQSQAALDDAYARFLEQRNYPIDMLNVRIGAVGTAPVVGTTTQTGGGGGSSFLSSLGGIGSAAAGIGQLAGLFGFSEDKAKTDMQRVGEDPETGIDLYAYRYKGDPKSYPKVIGPMASDIEEEYPEQIARIGNMRAVNLGFGPMQRAFR